MRIAMVGTRGVPARYGGFETCIEEVGRRLADRGHEVRVYCRSAEPLPPTYLGMRLVRLPALKKKSLETLSHTALSVGHLVRHRTDAALVFNSANSVFLPALRGRRIPVATHVDGLEWKRAKWGDAGRRYYRSAEALAVRWSDALIADAQGIADYYTEEFHAPSELISYGAPIITDAGSDRLAELGLQPRGFHLVVARFEPENHVAEIVEGYAASTASKPLVVVGSAPYADEYTARIRAAANDNVILIGAVWDQDQLNQLYANCVTYLHGHSVGGTNPSLLRAMGVGAATIAFDVPFNREVLLDSGAFFSDPASLASELAAAEADLDSTEKRGDASRKRAETYDWDDVAEHYENLCQRLVDRDFPRRRPSGRRHDGKVRA